MKQFRKYAVLLVLLALIAPIPGAACVDCIEKCWGSWIGCLEFCAYTNQGWEDCTHVGETCTIQPSQGCDTGDY